MGTDSPDFIKPVSQRKGGIEALFAKQAAKGKNVPQVSSNKQVSPTATSTPSTSKDGKSVTRAIDIDASPPSSPSPLDNRNQPTPARAVTHKRTMSGDPEGIPLNKRAKATTLEHEESQD